MVIIFTYFGHLRPDIRSFCPSLYVLWLSFRSKESPETVAAGGDTPRDGTHYSPSTRRR
jgi:hypothetical protein